MYLLIFVSQSAFGVEIVLNPKPQVSKDTCQSYQVAFGLAFIGDPAYRVETTKQLRAQERAFRAVLSEVANVATGEEKGNTTSHRNWQAAVTRFTAGKYALREAYFRNLADFYTKIASLTGNQNVETGGAAWAAFTAKQLVFTSVTRVDSNTYTSGHVIAVFGYQSAARMTPGVNMRLPIAVLNSAIKVRESVGNMWLC